jgi:hypothetical protein
MGHDGLGQNIYHRLWYLVSRTLFAKSLKPDAERFQSVTFATLIIPISPSGTYS